MKSNALIPVFKETFSDWGEDKAPRLAAALSYYTIFSVAPLILVVVAIAGLAFGREAAQGQIADQIRQVVGATSAKAIQDMLANARQPSHGIVATVVGFATLLLGAGGVFGALQDALNTIWGVAPKPGGGFMKMLRDRFLSFSMVLGLGFLLMVSLVVSAGLSAASKFIGGAMPGAPWLWELLNNVVSFSVFMLLFAMIFKVLPDAKVQWRDVWAGAFLTALLFTSGKFAIGLYLGRGSVGSAYGAAGSLVVLLLWIYYSAQILFFGAEFTKAYAKHFGSKISPKEDAVSVTADARAEQGLSPRPTGAELYAQPGKGGTENLSQPSEANIKYAELIGPGPPPSLAPSRNLYTAHAGDAIRTAGLIGVAIGLVVGLLRRPGQPESH